MLLLQAAVFCALGADASTDGAGGLSIAVSSHNFSISVSAGTDVWLDSSLAKLHTAAGWSSSGGAGAFSYRDHGSRRDCR